MIETKHQSVTNSQLTGPQRLDKLTALRDRNANLVQRIKTGDLTLLNQNSLLTSQSGKLESSGKLASENEKKAKQEKINKWASGLLDERNSGALENPQIKR